MMRIPIAFALAAGGLFGGPLAAQSNAVVFYGQAGRTMSVVDLAAGGADFAPAWVVGGGVALQTGTRFAFRVSYARAATTFRPDTAGAGVPFADAGATRTYLSLEVQKGWPGTSAWVPYMIVGGGLVRTDPVEASAAAKNQLGGHAGAGINWINGPSVLFVELSGWAYKFDGYGYSRAQLDMMVQAGMAIAVPF